jgi:hypothetical protein
VQDIKKFMKKDDWGYPESVDLAEAHLKKIESEIVTLSESYVSVIEQNLVPKAKTDMTKIFVLKMLADQCRTVS